MIFTPLQARSLITWYQTHKRDLPWRDTGNPYDVWISEIMLQQTRVEFVKDRFLQFRSELPDIPALAECSDERLMKLWEGMGYYSRARNLKKCAQKLCKTYEAVLPKTVEELIKLPGIGPYTAGAIASIAYRQPVPAVDGNVLRVIARYFEEERDIRDSAVKAEVTASIQQFYDACSDEMMKEFPSLPSLLNQALMELGAIICVPNGQPRCTECPWSHTCKAYLHQKTDQIPYRSALKERTIQQRTILVILDGSRFLLHKRPDKGLLAGLYEFPGYEGYLSRKEALDAVRELGLSPVHIKKLPDSRHIFSHIEWHMKAYEILTDNIDQALPEGYVLLNKKELRQFAVPSAFHTYKDWYSLQE